MLPLSKFINKDKKSEIFETDLGYIIKFYTNDKLVHTTNIELTENPYIIAEDFVHNGDSAPKLLID